MESSSSILPRSMESSSSQDLIPGPRPPSSLRSILVEPFQWLRMLCRELNGSFVLGIFLVYGLSQGFAGSFFRVVTDYYWKDVHRLQPSSVQIYSAFYYLPWVIKPLWGLLTDAVPFRGYRRRPYFLLAGTLGTAASLAVSAFPGLSVPQALLCLVGITAAVAIADVTIDACIARNSIERPELAPDMQSLCGFVSSVGALVGYSTSGLFLRILGPQGALGIMAVPMVLLVLLGFVIFELRTTPTAFHRSSEKTVIEKVESAVRGMGRTIKSPHVWKPSLYMFLSLALNISTHEGEFYWYTNPKAGPGFSQEFIGMIYAIGALASIVGVLIYHKLLKGCPFRSLLFYAQLFYGVSGMLDLVFVLRWNLKLMIPDYIFVMLEECFGRIISRIRWMPMIVLSTRLCPLGIEGTFFALLMSIDSMGSLSSKTIGGIVLHMFNVTRTDFKNLWLVLLMRNLLRFSTLALIFLVPKADQSEAFLPPSLLDASICDDEESVQLTQLKDVENL